MKINTAYRNLRINQNGFTLVELLVVIAMVSMLAGGIFMIINPVQQKRKASEVVLKSNVSKVCIVIQACGAVKSTASSCDQYTELGAQAPTEPGIYTLPLVGAGTRVTFSGTYDTCVYDCWYEFSDGTFTNLTKGAGCL